MASGSSNSRLEERRKRIVERGSDRLALITGQVQSIPPPPPSPSRLLHASSSFNNTSTPEEDTYRHPLLAKQSKPAKATKGRDETSSSSSSSSSVSPTKKPGDTATYGAIKSPLAAAATTEINSRSASPPPPSSSITYPETPQPPNPHQNLLDPRLITSAIASTERVRLFCSTTAGFLVVFSYTGFPILGTNIFTTIMILRPLYFLLLTNISVVVAKLMLSNTLKPGKVGNDNNNNENGVDWVAQVGSSLEMGYLMMKVMDAVLMDCSLYATVVVCFLSLHQMLF